MIPNPNLDYSSVVLNFWPNLSLVALIKLLLWPAFTRTPSGVKINGTVGHLHVFTGDKVNKLCMLSFLSSLDFITFSLIIFIFSFELSIFSLKL